MGASFLFIQTGKTGKELQKQVKTVNKSITDAEVTWKGCCYQTVSGKQLSSDTLVLCLMMALRTSSFSLTSFSPIDQQVCLFVGCLTSQQHASVSQGRICIDNFTCCHTEIQVADQTFHLTQSQYTDTRLISPSADPIAPGTWQDSHWSANV